MNIFENLIDVNTAAIRYKMSAQGIKQQIGNKIEENIDCKKFGNSWVFVKSNLDVIFRERLDDNEHKQLLKPEQNMLKNMGKELMNEYKKKYGEEASKEFINEMNQSVKYKNKFIHKLLDTTLCLNTTIKGDFTYCIMNDYYPENMYYIISGMINELNKKQNLRTVREWIKDYKDGKFEEATFENQINAGWSGWNEDCSAAGLQLKLEKLADIILELKNENLLDNYCIKIYNKCTDNLRRYDEFFFVPLNMEENKPLSLKLYEDGKYIFE